MTNGPQTVPFSPGTELSPAVREWHHRTHFCRIFSEVVESADQRSAEVTMSLPKVCPGPPISGPDDIVLTESCLYMTRSIEMGTLTVCCLYKVWIGKYT